jgi:hypothetical protein
VGRARYDNVVEMYTDVPDTCDDNVAVLIQAILWALALVFRGS